MNLLIKADNVLAKFEHAVLVVLVAAMTLILVAQVILRYFFSSPIFWAEEVAVQILMMVTCIRHRSLGSRKEAAEVRVNFPV